MSEMRCPRCGNVVPPMTDRCPMCGTPLSNGVLPQLQFVDAVKMVFQKYADFSGRSRRSEFWWFYLFGLIVGVAINIISLVSGTLGYILAGLYWVATIVPNLAVSVRRLHDIGKSGWNLLWMFLPIVGAILLIVWWVKDSDPRPNEYGPSPKYMM